MFDEPLRGEDTEKGVMEGKGRPRLRLQPHRLNLMLAAGGQRASGIEQLESA